MRTSAFFSSFNRHFSSNGKVFLSGRRLSATAFAAIAPILVVVSAPALGGIQQLLATRVLLATVTDTGSRVLYDLGPDDFVVDEHGEPRNVLAVNIADYPIAILLDNSGRAASQLEDIRAAAARFVNRSGERPIAVAGLAAPATLAASFDTDRRHVLDVINALPSGTGEPLPLEASANAANAIKQLGAPFSAIVILSAGSIESDPAAGDLLRPILESGATIHVIANQPAGAPPGSSPSNDVLRALADQTKGQYTTIYSPASYSIALDRLASRLATEMMIQYVVPPGARPGGDVRVGVKIPGATVRGLGVR
jgi:hypothetical protein